MAQKLSSRQVAQLEYLQTLPQRFQRIHAVIEEMSALRADDVVVRGLSGCWMRSRGSREG